MEGASPGASDAVGSEVEPVLAYEGVAMTAPDGTEVLRHVDLVVGGGRLTVLAGPSGAGKSTVLRLANRLEVPTTGVVRFRGTDLADLDSRDLRRRVGMVFQRPVVFGGTVRDNLRVAASGADDDVLGTTLGRVGLPAQILDRSGDDLSGGEAQRMCVARTLLTGPEVLLMDEPTSSLDPANRRAVEDLARDLVDGGLTVLWVTHDLPQARRLADEVVVLVDGRVVGADDAARYMDGADELRTIDDEPEEGAR